MRWKLLFALAAVVLGAAGLAEYWNLQVRATPEERARAAAGDELIVNPVGSVTHAITIRRPAHDVWPWLAQMGSGRAGWYAYDFIDNGRQPSSRKILPEYQNVQAGTIMPALPGARDVFVVAKCVPDKNLVLAWRLPSGKYQTTWAFVLEHPTANETRLLVRGRAAEGYRPFGLPQWIATRLGSAAHFVMQRKQLAEIAERAEATP